MGRRSSKQTVILKRLSNIPLFHLHIKNNGDETYRSAIVPHDPQGGPRRVRDHPTRAWPMRDVNVYFFRGVPCMRKQDPLRPSYFNSNFD